MTTFKTGDVVYCEGSSAILGDVIRVEDDGFGGQAVDVRWRETETTETDEDLILKKSA